ncbi:MFS transporter [Lentzea sp. NPDC051208]|uniref:MFS transporter n=1 Tax=Lentzea sp. NPDC051208 TaxID=3154642 RepID=UPI0034460DF2
MSDSSASSTHEGGAVMDPPATPIDPAQSRDIGKLPPFFSAIFSTRAVSLAVNVLVVTQLTFYATNSIGLSAGLIGGLFLLAKVVDAATDIFVSFAVDRTRTRWGKARPYELLIIPIWLLTIAVFSTPDMAPSWQAAYIFVLFLLITSVCQTFLNKSEGLYLKRAIRGETRYAKVLSRQGVIIVICAGVGHALLPQLIALWGNRPGGWTLIATVYAVPLMILGLVRFFFIKETVTADELAAEQNVSFRDGLRSLMSNKYAFVLAGIVLAANIIITGNGVVGTYYFTYILGNVQLLSLITAAGAVTPFIYLFFPLAVRKFGAINFVRVGLAIAALGYALVVLSPRSLGMVVFGQVLGSLTTIITMLVGYFAIQCMAYGEWRTGHRSDAVTTTVISFSAQVGQGAASGVIGVVMGVAGFNGLVATQTPRAEEAIIGLYSTVPLVLTLLMFGLTFLYRLDSKSGAVNADLAADIHAGTSALKL